MQQINEVNAIDLSVPINSETYRELAREKIDKKAFGYIDSGSGSEWSLVENIKQYHRYSLVPRVLRDVSAVDQSITLLGREIRAPYLLAPVGFQTIVHDDGERASAQASNHAGIPFVQSTVSSYTIEEIRASLPDAPHYFQLYWPSDVEVCDSLIKRAEASGVDALVITVDTPLLGRREVDLAHAYFPMETGAGMANFLSDPVFQAKYNPTGTLTESALKQAIQKILFHPGLTFQALKKLRDETALPIIIKGVLNKDDAKELQALGVDGIIVSNHGGRQLDSAVAPLEVLADVRAAVGPSFPLLVDGGVRRGSDIIKALALGADAVLIGRPYIYGLIDGETGVRQVLSQLSSDLQTNLALLGVTDVSQLDQSYIKNAE